MFNRNCSFFHSFNRQFLALNLNDAAKGLDEAINRKFNLIDHFSDDLNYFNNSLSQLKELIIKRDLVCLISEIKNNETFKLILGFDGSNGYINSNLCDLINLLVLLSDTIDNRGN